MSVRSRLGILQDMKPVTGMPTVLERGLLLMIGQNFKDAKNWQVVSDLRRYKPSMDPFVYGQKIGRIPEVCEIYWNGEFVCTVSLLDRPATALIKLNDGMIDLIKKKKGVS